MYLRSTRAVTIAELPSVLGDEVARHAASHQIDLDRTRAWLTHSVNPPATSFVGKLVGRRANSVDADAEHDTVLVLQATHILVGTSGARRGTSVLSLPLVVASVTRGSGLARQLTGKVPGADDGMTISGLPGHKGQPGTYFVGLGAEPAATECFTAIEAAISAAKNQR